MHECMGVQRVKENSGFDKHWERGFKNTKLTFCF